MTVIGYHGPSAASWIHRSLVGRECDVGAEPPPERWLDAHVGYVVRGGWSPGRRDWRGISR